jgi:hypothetical protein
MDRALEVHREPGHRSRHRIAAVIGPAVEWIVPLGSL